MELSVLSLLVLALVATVQAGSLQRVVRAQLPDGRIIKGHDAAPGEAPYIVSIQYWGGHFCGGVILNEHWVLTAAHCLEDYYGIKVIAGLYAQNDRTNAQLREVYGKKYQIKHELFKGGVSPYDIGLVYVNQPFDLTAVASDGTPLVRPIALPSGEYEPTGRGKLYGWGRDYWSELPNILQTLDMDIIDYDECKAELPIDSLLHETNICANNKNVKDGACYGDSGGPLVKVQPNGVTELIGVVSWGYTPCLSTAYPDVLTWTQPFEQWIAQTIENFVP